MRLHDVEGQWLHGDGGRGVTRRGWIVFGSLGVLLIAGITWAAVGGSGPSTANPPSASSQSLASDSSTTAPTAAAASTTPSTTSGARTGATTRPASRGTTTTASPPTTTAPPTTTTTPLSCSASMSDPTPNDGGDETLTVSSDVPNTSGTATAQYKTTDHSIDFRTDGSGSASVTFSIGQPTVGYRVGVSVDISGGADCSTSFIPQ